MTDVTIEISGQPPIRTTSEAISRAAAQTRETPSTKFAKDRLRSIIERIERLEEEKKTISDDIRDVYAEAKGQGYCTKAVRTIRAMISSGGTNAAIASGFSCSPANINHIRNGRNWKCVPLIERAA